MGKTQHPVLQSNYKLDSDFSLRDLLSKPFELKNGRYVVSKDRSRRKPRPADPPPVLKPERKSSKRPELRKRQKQSEKSVRKKKRTSPPFSTVSQSESLGS